MRTVIADANMMAKLRPTEGPVEVIGPDGTRLGYFTPSGPPVKYNLDPGISEEEIARRFADKTSPTYTTAEVLAHLKGL